MASNRCSTAQEGAADHAGILLRPCAAGLLRAGRHREECSRGQEEWQTGLPNCAEGGQAPRRETLSRFSEVLKPINYMIKRWADFAASSTMAGSASATTSLARHCLGKAQQDLRRFPARRRSRRRMLTGPRHALTTSTRKPGLPTSWPALPIFPPRVCTNYCLGMEAPAQSRQARQSAGRLTFTQRHHRVHRAHARVPMRPSSYAYGQPKAIGVSDAQKAFVVKQGKGHAGPKFAAGQKDAIPNTR